MFMNGLYMDNGFNIGVVNDHIEGTIFCKLYHTLEWEFP